MITIEDVREKFWADDSEETLKDIQEKFALSYDDSITYISAYIDALGADAESLSKGDRLLFMCSRMYAAGAREAYRIFAMANQSGVRELEEKEANAMVMQ